MTRLRLFGASALLVLGLTGCDGLKRALTAHTDVVARVGSQELTVQRLAELLGDSDVPLRPDVIRSVAQLWVDYQLVALAASKGDTLGTIEDADEGMRAALDQQKVGEALRVIGKQWGVVDSATLEAKYNEGILLGAQHILIGKPRDGVSPERNAALRSEAERIAKSVTAATFADVAKRRSDDPGSKDRAGSYPVIAPEDGFDSVFVAGIRALKPGQISGVIETQFGYHVIRRHAFAEVKEQFGEAYASVAAQEAMSTFLANLDSTAKVKVKPTAAKLVKAIAQDPEAFRSDDAVIATSKPVTLTAMKVSRWMSGLPPQQVGRLQAELVGAPDSAIAGFVESIMQERLVLHIADSLKVTVDSARLAQIRQWFHTAVTSVMQALEVMPNQLGDSAATPAKREELAAARANSTYERLLRKEVEGPGVPAQVAGILRDRYEYRVTPAGLDRVLAEATKRRAVADSARAATMPPSAVPMGPPTATPAPATPAPQP